MTTFLGGTVTALDGQEQPVADEQSDDDSPFAHIPTPGIYERPSAITPAAEVDFYNAVAQGTRRSKTLRIVLLSILLALFLAGIVGALASTVFSHDSEPPTPVPPPDTIQTLPPLPTAPPPAT
jgi:hypothetical protein